VKNDKKVLAGVTAFDAFSRFERRRIRPLKKLSHPKSLLSNISNTFHVPNKHYRPRKEEKIGTNIIANF
jgi:hypothetical protein